MFQCYQYKFNINTSDYFTSWALITKSKQTSDDKPSIYLNFEKGGIIKQYGFERAEFYKGMNEVEGIKAEYELHLVHKKNLGYKSNKNQYRTISDANNYLTIVLRYNLKENCNECSSDDNLFLEFANQTSRITDLETKYQFFQDKRAYLYEGSFVFTPCDEDVNYYVVKDIFFIDTQKCNFVDIKNYLDSHDINIKKSAYSFGRPVYRNF